MGGRGSLRDVAEAVLRAEPDGRPLHYREITRLGIERGLLTPGGLTPEASMSAALSMEVRGIRTGGRPPRFRAYGKGLYGLRRTQPSAASTVERQNEVVRRRLRDALATMHPRAFEELIAQLLTATGFEDVEVTNYSGDGGVDVRGRLAVGGMTDVWTAIQVKRWSKNVPDRIVRELRGGLGTHERGLIITLSDFTPASRQEAEKPDRVPISLVNGGQLVDLLVEYSIGVVRRDITVLELDEGSIGLSAEDDEDEATVSAPAGPAARGLGGRGVWIWPLPGGRKGWRATLRKMLAEVARNQPTVSAAVSWMVDEFQKVQSPQLARAYWNVPRRMGLVDVTGEELQLTSAGATFMSTNDDGFLLAHLQSTIAGFVELLRALEGQALSEEEGLDLLRRELGVGWKTTAQTKYRLGWLENLGAVERVGRVYRLRDASEHP